MTTWPPTAIGRWKVACMPSTADWGTLMMGVDMSEPKMPPLVTVKVPPAMSSTVSVPALALAPRDAISFSMSARDILSALRSTWRPERRRAGGWGGGTCGRCAGSGISCGTR
eukprot:scaffold3765_cov122-Isochrysis_galbana.AAC.3